MKMVLAEPPVWANRRVELQLNKPDRDERLIITHGDTGEQLMELTIEKGSRSVIVNASKSAKLQIYGEATGKTKPAPKKVALPKDRSWRIEETEDGKLFTCWLPNGNEISLPVVDAGEATPAESIHEVVGQPAMLFAVCLAIKEGKHSLLTGPTGIAKTTVYRWLAQKLGYNLVIAPISRGTQDLHLRGEYAPAGPGDFKWMDGPVTRAARLSQKHPTILLFDELNRIGNVAEFSRVYSLLDDTRMIELPERLQPDGTVEIVHAGDLYVGATANPVEDEGGDYLGVKELDPAFNSRFAIQPPLKYPSVNIEAQALADRVPALDIATAKKMVEAAKKIRDSHEIRFPISFRELEAWALALPHYGMKDAAEVAVISKAAPSFRGDIRNLLQLVG